MTLVLMAAALAGVGGCFKPNITDGGFFCTDAGACPEDFSCNAIDRRCYRGHGGPEARACTDAAPAPPQLCDDQPAGGQACNPTCQTGCGCGQRCALVGTAREPACKLAGQVGPGEACTLAADDCGAGFVCVNECGGTATTGRCLQFCKAGNECSNGRRCSIPVEGTPFMACEAGARACQPVAKSGCPTSALACYLGDAPDTKCECEGGKAGGATCALDTECVAGFQCVSFAGQILCRKICATQTDCPLLPVPTTCTRTVQGAPFGFCL